MNSAIKKRCCICGSKLTIELKDVFDTRFGIESRYDIGRFAICGIEQILPFPSIKDLKDLYETYYNFGGEKDTGYTDFRDYFILSGIYRFWLTVDGDISFHKQKGFGRLLDIGCNEGRGLSIYKKNGFEVEGLELNEQAAAEARRHGFNVYSDPVEQFEQAEGYDVVVLSNVLEHSIDPKRMLYHVFRILKPGGQVWISCPNNRSWLRYLFGRYWINWHVPFHLFHFSRKTIEQLLERCGFEINKIKFATPSHWMTQSLLAAIFSTPDQPTRQLRSPFLVASLMIFCRFTLFPFLWLGNLTGRGDCLIVEAVVRAKV